MPRTLKYQRLNRSPKHRWSMLRNMTASLFLHERIVTTEARAKSLISAANKIFAKAIKGYKGDHHSMSIARGWVRVDQANYKLSNDLIRRFMLNTGGIARMISLFKRRKGDCSKMAVVELLNNPHKEKEEADFDKVHSASGLNYSKWELFTRKNELESYISEKEKRDQIYVLIKEKIKKLKENSEIVSELDIKTALFGEYLHLFKVESDSLLPPSHYFNLYIKATKGEVELDKFYKKTDSHMKHLIRNAKEQIQLLETKINDPKKGRNYEKKTFKAYYESYYQDVSKLQKQYSESKDERQKRNEVLNVLGNLRNSFFEKQVKSVKLINFAEAYFKRNNLDPYNLSLHQRRDFRLETEQFQRKNGVDEYFKSEDIKEYENLLKRGDSDRKASKKIRLIKEKILKANREIAVLRTHPKKDEDVIPIQNPQLLSQAEMNLKNLDTLKDHISSEAVTEMKKFEAEKKEKLDRIKQLHEYETMLRKFNDRQVKKRYKPSLYDLKDKRQALFGEAEKKEIVEEEDESLSRRDVIIKAYEERIAREKNKAAEKKMPSQLL